ncbi:hypothetical protein F5Y01DRAFT_304789 [Xylaria sp. FL0043]|nr:hypothetical protein F5Y01DRAFT_304789 [Xylaria sp. FL0043]
MTAPYTFAHASRCGQEIIVVDIVFTTIALTFLGLRFWSARCSGRKFALDDLFVLVGFSGAILLVFSGFWGAVSGLGKHITELKLDQITRLVKNLLVAEFGYLLGTFGIKMSMLCLYHRIYATPTFRRWNYCAMALLVIYLGKYNRRNQFPFHSIIRLLTPDVTVGFIPLFLTNCIPLSQYWDPQPGGWCRDTIIGDNATVAVNLVLDFIVLTLPLPILWRLRMSVRDKLTVTALFGFGFVTIALVIWRLVVTEKTRGSLDWTASLCQVGEIAQLEILLGITAVCIPTLGPLFNAYMKPLLVRMGLTSNQSKPAGNSYLVTFGSSGKNKKSRKYDTLNDSADHIVSRDDQSIKLTPTVEGKVVSECTFQDTYAGNHGRDGIRVQRDIEAQYHTQNRSNRNINR